MKVSIQEDMYEVMSKMPDEQGDRLLRALVTYGFTGEEPEASGEPWYFVFLAFKGRIEMSASKSRGGSAGARTRWAGQGGEATQAPEPDPEMLKTPADGSAEDAADTHDGSSVLPTNSHDGYERIPMTTHDGSDAMLKTTHHAESESEKEKEKESEIETEHPSPGTPPSDVDEFSTPGVTVEGVEGIQGSGRGKVPLACMRRSEDGRAFYGSGDERLFRTQVEALHDRYREATGRDDFRDYVRRVDGLCPKTCRGDPERAAQCFEVMCRAIDQWDSRKAPRGPYGLTRAMLAGVAGREG